MRDVEARTGEGRYQQIVQVGPHRLLADEAPDKGGDDAGPEPHEWLLAALGSCTSMTLRMYAERKGWALRSVSVRVAGRRDGQTLVLEQTVTLDGDLDAAQRARLHEISGRCPVARSLLGGVRIVEV